MDWLWPVVLGVGPAVGLALFLVNVLRRPLSRTLREHYIRRRQLALPKHINTYDIGSKEYDISGYEPTASEVELENLKPISDDKSVDGVLLWASDSGNSVLFRLVRRTGRRIEVWLWAEINNRRFVMPGHPDSTVYNCNPRSMEGGGIKLEVVEPMRKLRITFNGFLRHENENISARMNFIWTAVSSPFDCKRDNSAILLTQQDDCDAKGLWDSISCNELYGYEQFGILSGTVELPHVEPHNLYLRGFRSHRWGKEIATHLKESVTMMGCCDNGFFFRISENSYINGRLSKLCSGHVLLPTINVHAIDQIHQLPIFTEKTINSENLSFTANSTKYDISLTSCCPPVSIYGGRPWNTHNKIQLATCVVNGELNGRILIVNKNRWNHLCPIPTEYSLPYLEEPLLKLGSLPLTADFKSIISQCSKYVGGKGASLALMTSIKQDDFVVSPGFCITTEAFERQLISSDDKLSSAIQLVADVACGKEEGDLQSVCDSVVSVISSTPICSSVCDEIISAMGTTFSSMDWQVAVRSSAVGEDSEELSAAGQNDTFLGVKSEDSLMESVRKCWASPYSFRSVEYRRQYGQEIRVPMCVVVQQMVPADVAGVLFTRNPVTGSPAEMHVTANYGLAESVVSGSAEPDTITVERTWDGRLSIKENIIGSKELKIVVSEKGGCEEIRIDGVSDMCVSESDVLKISKIAIKLEKHYGYPLDIEWALSQGQVYLLQARPISSLQQWSDLEIQQELDGASLTNNDCFTKANTGEVLPQATTPLSISITVKGLDLAIQYYNRNIANDPCHITPHRNRVIIPFSSHVFMNVLDTFLKFNNSNKIDIDQKTLGIVIFGHEVFTQELLNHAVDRYGLISKMLMLKLLRRLYQSLFCTDPFLKKALDKYGSFKLDISSLTKSCELFDEIKQNLPALTEASGMHARVSESSSASQTIVMSNLASKKEWSMDLMSELSQILSSGEQIITTRVPIVLKQVAEAIESAGNSEQFISMDATKKVTWLLSAESGKAGKCFEQFLDEFGHHGPKEFDFGVPSWAMDPSQPLSTITSLLSSNSVKNANNSNESIHRNLGNPVEKLLQSSSRLGRPLLRKLLNSSQHLVACRERSKTMLIRVVNEFRKAYTKLGHLLVLEGVLPEYELIFYVTQWEINKLIQDRSPSVIRKAKIRRRLHQELEKLQFSELCYGAPKPVVPCISQQNGSDVLLRATPASCGIVKGIARVVVHLSDAHEIQRGDVLITYGTNIGWTPYFSIISGVVTELGGTLSHGTVVARDHGIPCVVGATGATNMFHSGDIVILNGSAGTIEKINDGIEDNIQN